MSTKSQKSQSIYQKLHAVMSEVDYIQKDKKNTFHGYSYASEQAIKEALHAALVKNGVLFMVDIVSSENERIQGKSGESILTTAQFKYRFFDAETGDCVEGTFQGTGIDNQDKALYKAITGAIKYILTSTFLIPTGDDPEQDAKPEKESKPAPQKQSKSKPPEQVTSMMSEDQKKVLKQLESDHRVKPETADVIEKILAMGATQEQAARVIKKAQEDMDQPAEIESDELEHPDEVTL